MLTDNKHWFNYANMYVFVDAWVIESNGQIKWTQANLMPESKIDLFHFVAIRFNLMILILSSYEYCSALFLIQESWMSLVTRLFILEKGKTSSIFLNKNPKCCSCLNFAPYHPVIFSTALLLDFRLHLTCRTYLQGKAFRIISKISIHFVKTYSISIQ